MADLRASLDMLRDFRRALANFGHAQSDVSAAALQAALAVASRIDAARIDAKRAVDRTYSAYQACLSDAAAAAYDGGWVDCSGSRKALDAAEQRLSQVERTAREFDAAIREYHSAHGAMASTLAGNLSHGLAYLDRLVDGIEQYRGVETLSWSHAVARGDAPSG